MADWFVLNNNFFNQLSQISIGKTVNLTSTLDKKSYPFTRQQDITISGVPAKVYASTYVTQYGKRSKYALFKNNGYTYLLAVEWDNPKNAQIFDLVTSSFIFSLRPDSEIIHF